LVAAQVQDFGPAHATATTKFLAATTAEDGNDCGGSSSGFFDCADSESSIEWTESSEDLDYFAALDVAAMEASPRVTDAGVVRGPCTGRRRRRAVAKRMVSGVEGARLGVSGAGRQELLALPTVEGVGERELRSLFAGEELRIMLFNYREMGIIPKVEPM
jgi:hypothetical protein